MLMPYPDDVSGLHGEPEKGDDQILRWETFMAAHLPAPADVVAYLLELKRDRERIAAALKVAKRVVSALDDPSYTGRGLHSPEADAVLEIVEELEK